MEFNKVIVAGNLGRDPELKYTGNGKAVCQARLAVVTSKRKNDDGSYDERTAWIDVEFWERTAEMFCEYHKKGDNVFVEGRLAMDEWEDKNTGQKRSKIKIIGDRWQFTSKKGEADAARGEQRQGQDRKQEERRPQRENRPTRTRDDDFDDDVPF